MTYSHTKFHIVILSNKTNLFYIWLGGGGGEALKKTSDDLQLQCVCY